MKGTRRDKRGASAEQTSVHASFVFISHAFSVLALLARRNFLPNT